MDRRVNHKRGGVEHSIRSTVDDRAGVVDLDQVGCFDQGECRAKGIYPECGRVDGITKSNVAGNTCC